MGKRKKSTRTPGAGRKKMAPLGMLVTYHRHGVYVLVLPSRKSRDMQDVRDVSYHSDDKARIGYLSCKICGQKFSADTDTLSQPIDVYS